jgi:hypothetical protein
MRVVLVLVFVAISAGAQDQAAVAAAQAACGPKNAKFSAIQDHQQHPTPDPDPEKALVYVVQELGELKCEDCALTRIGLDGSWVGANQGSSYFFFWTGPGEHHLCLNWQSWIHARSQAVALANFSAEAGTVYYFRARIFYARENYSFDLDAINSDQGKYLVASSALCASHTKK